MGVEGQRFLGRPSRRKLFSERRHGKASRERLIARAIANHGYSQMEVASFLGLHYSTISRIVAGGAEEKIKTLSQVTPASLELSKHELGSV